MGNLTVPPLRDHQKYRKKIQEFGIAAKGTGSDKLPCFDHLPSELSYLAQPGLGAFSSASIPQHPLFGHIYPWSAGSDQQTLGRNHFSPSISQNSTAAALVARYVNANLSTHKFQDFSNRLLTPNTASSDDTIHNEEPSIKKSRFQFDVENLSGASPTSQPDDVVTTPGFRNSNLPSPGSLSTFPAWQHFLFRCRSLDTFDATMHRLNLLQTNLAHNQSHGRNRPHSESNFEPALDRANELGSQSMNNESAVTSPKTGTQVECSREEANVDVVRSGDEDSTEGIHPSNTTQQFEDKHRSRRKRTSSIPRSDVCPVCGVTVRTTDLQSHIVCELEKLYRIPSEIFRKYKNPGTLLLEKRSNNTSQTSTGTTWISGKKSALRESDRASYIKTFEKVRSNRLERLNTRVSKNLHVHDLPIDATGMLAWTGHLPASCPVCFARLAGDQSVTRDHISRCLRQRNVGQHLGVDGEVDVVTPSSGETDTPNDAPPLMKRRHDSDSEQCLNVDRDDSHLYGPLQYDDEVLKKLVENDEAQPMNDSSASPTDEMVCSLRSKIARLENEAGSCHCMICMNPYKDPVTSIQCWHVHCERCWLQVLRVKKLCPQCNTITPLNKLRRIYL